MSDFIANSQLLRWDNTLAGDGIVFTRIGGLGKNVSISVNTNVIATVSSLEAYQQVSGKDVAGGYAGLDASGKIDTSLINFDTSTFYRDANGILKIKTDRISNPFTATGLGTDGVPTGLTLGEDAATLAEVEVNDTIRFSAAISWNGTDYDAQTVFMRVATTAGTLADFAVQGAPVTSMDQLEQGGWNKYVTAEQLEKLIRMNYSDIAYTGQLSSTADDCDSYLISGVWNVPNASAIANTPNKGQGGILFCFQRGTYSTSARVQVYLQSAGSTNPVIPYVRVYNGTAATWSAWERIIKSTDLATTAANGLMSASDKAKLDNTLPQSDSDVRYIINGRTGEKKMCLTSNAEIPAEGALSYIAACGYGAENAICSGLTVARRANGSYAVYLQTFGENSTLEVCSKGAATVLGYSKKTFETAIYGKTINLSGESVLCNGSTVFTIAMARSSDYLATVSANGLMSAADKAKLDTLKTQTQLDEKYAVNTAGNSSGKLLLKFTPQTFSELTTVAQFATQDSSYEIQRTAAGAEAVIAIAKKGNVGLQSYVGAVIFDSYKTGVKASRVTLDGATFTFSAPGKTASQIQTAADVDVFMKNSLYLATTVDNGLMSATDKTKLDKLTPDVFSGTFDFALAPTQGQLVIVLKNAPAVAPWNFHSKIEVQQFSGAPADRSEPARYVAEGHFAVGEYDLLVTGFPITAANGTYKDSGGRVWTHSTASQYQIKYANGRWRIFDGATILYSTHSDDGNPYGTIGSADGSWIWCNGDTMTYLTGPKVIADTATVGAASWRSVNYNATSISNFLYAGKYTVGGVTHPALFLTGKFTQGKVIVRHLDYNATPVAAELELVASTSAVGTIQADAAKRWDAVPGNVEWDALTAQLIQATNRADGVRRSYCAALTLGGSAYSGVFGWSATACTVAVPVVSLDLQNTPTDFTIDIAVEAAAAEKAFSLALTNGIQGTHCMVSFRNVSTYRIGMTDGNGKTVYLAGGETALARLVSVNAENRFEWISAGTAGGSTGGTEYVSFTAADVDANGNLVIIATGEPVAICKTDLSNRVDLGITAQESAAAGRLKSTINVAGIVLGTGTWYAICK